MMYLIGALLIMLLAVVIVALSYRSIAKEHQRQYEMQRQRAEGAEFANTNRQQLDTALETLHETQREETIHATDKAHLAGRSDFDNNWSDDSGLRDNGTGAAHTTTTATATANPTGAAGYQVEPDDMLGR